MRNKISLSFEIIDSGSSVFTWFYRSRKIAEEYERHPACKSILEKLKVFAVGKYAENRKISIVKGGIIAEGNDAFPFKSIMGIESIKEFWQQYTEEDCPKNTVQFARSWKKCRED